VLGSDFIAVIDRHKKIPFFFIIARASPFCQWEKDQNLIFCASLITERAKCWFADSGASSKKRKNKRNLLKMQRKCDTIGASEKEECVSWIH
jgi:hypothetical protein